MSFLNIGSHLVSQRIGYRHHGIYVGKGNVVHYSGFADRMNTGRIEETTLEKFSAGSGYKVKNHDNRVYSSATIVKRARSRIGEDLYDLFSNNCEHFVNWCIEGDHKSTQVDAGTCAATAGMLGVTGVASRVAIASVGSGVMSGLATVGSVLGGGGLAAASLINNQ